MRTLCGTIFAAAVTALSAYGKFDVRDFGAKGDGVAKDTTAIQSAIDRCGESGGGRVVLANGTFLSGSIQLRTGVELHIDGTARLLRSKGSDPSVYVLLYMLDFDAAEKLGIDPCGGGDFGLETAQYCKITEKK